MNITVIIPTHGRPDLLKRTLRSLSECHFPASFERVIIVENGSREGAEEVTESYAHALEVRYIHIEKANKSHALNKALELVQAGLVVFFDDDVRLHPDVLVHYAQEAGKLEAGAFFGGPIGVDYEGSPPPEWLVSSLPPSVVGWKGPAEEDHPFFLGANWAAFASDIKRVGGFSEQIGPGTGSVGQETEMQRRLLEAGVEQVFISSAKVWHFVPKERCSSRWLLQRYFRMGKGDGQNGWEVSGRWIGFHSWVWFELGRRSRLVLQTMLSTDREKHFAAKRKLIYFVGKMQGFRSGSLKEPHQSQYK